MTRRLLLPTVTSLLATACLSGDSASHSSIVRDSAGVRIAENPSDARGEEWRLQIPAVLEIGRSEGQGPGPDLFGSVRHAILLSTGDIAVADGLAAEVRVFDEDGGHLLTFGGRGEGPGNSSISGRLWSWRVIPSQRSTLPGNGSPSSHPPGHSLDRSPFRAFPEPPSRM